MEKLYHQCVGWELNPGHTCNCRICRKGKLGTPPGPPRPQPRYSYDTAVDRLDQLAGKLERKAAR